MAFKGEDHLDSLQLPVQRMHLIQMDSVQRWMEDLKLMTDCECMCILQSKPISIEKDEQNELMLSSQYSTCDNLQLLLKRAWIISTELTRIAQKLEKNRWQRVHSMTVRVNCHVRSMINEYNTFTRNSSEEMHQFEKLLLDKCSEFTAFTERCIQTEDEQILKSMKSSINETLTNVAQYFGQLIELVLTHEAQDFIQDICISKCELNLLRQIELSNSMYITESAISSLFSLTQEGSHLCRIIAKVEDSVMDVYDLVYEEVRRNASSFRRHELTAIHEAFLCCGKHSPFGDTTNVEHETCPPGQEGGAEQDCLREIHDFLKKHMDFVSTLLGVTIGFMVYGMILTSFLWFSIHFSSNLERKGRYVLRER